MQANICSTVKKVSRENDLDQNKLCFHQPQGQNQVLAAACCCCLLLRLRYNGSPQTNVHAASYWSVWSLAIFRLLVQRSNHQATLPSSMYNVLNAIEQTNFFPNLIFESWSTDLSLEGIYCGKKKYVNPLEISGFLQKLVIKLGHNNRQTQSA